MVVRGECYTGFVSFLLWRNQLFRVLDPCLMLVSDYDNGRDSSVYKGFRFYKGFR